MSVEITISSKGQVVIPKDFREALGLTAGGKLRLERIGQRLVLEAPQPPRERISYEEFRRRVPKYEGPPVAIEDMTPDFDYLWRQRDDRGGA